MLIRDLLAADKPSFSFEFFPPKNDEAATQLERTIAELSVLKPAFVSVTYGAGGSTREKTIEIVSRIKQETGIEAMAHLTCVGSTREELRDILKRLCVNGVQNILALRGDPPKGETAFQAVQGGFSYASELVTFIREELGNSVCIGGAGYPETHVECTTAQIDMDNLKRKVDAGLDFITTQLFYENRVYFDFVDRAQVAGIKVPIVPGIMPISNAGQPARFGAVLPGNVASELHRRQDDLKAVQQLGVAHATAQCMDLLMGGAPGIHFYTLNRSTATAEIYAALSNSGFARRNEAA